MTDDARKRAWLTRLFDEYGSALEGYLYKRTRNHAIACELAQETYLRMWQVKDIDEILEPKSYMFTIARNLANNSPRRDQTWDSFGPDDPKPEDGPADSRDFPEEIADEEILTKIRKAFDKLRPEQRAAWYLKHAHGLTYEEIAQRLGVSKDTVKKYLQQVISLCRTELGLDDDEDEE